MCRKDRSGGIFESSEGPAGNRLSGLPNGER
jgi:hypothetical protein